MKMKLFIIFVFTVSVVQCSNAPDVKMPPKNVSEYILKSIIFGKPNDLKVNDFGEIKTLNIKTIFSQKTIESWKFDLQFLKILKIKILLNFVTLSVKTDSSF